jgi:hypothetical protein
MASIFDYPAMLCRILLPAKDKMLHFPQIGLTITLPKKFHLLSHKQMGRMDSKYRKRLKEKTGKTLARYIVNGQFWAEFELENRFGCNIVSLDDLPETEWKNKNIEKCNAMLSYYHATYKEYAHVSVNTEQDARQKGDIIFETFDIIAATPGRELHRTRYYTTIYKNYGLHITMSFADAMIGEEMLNILRASTFT